MKCVSLATMSSENKRGRITVTQNDRQARIDGRECYSMYLIGLAGNHILSAATIRPKLRDELWTTQVATRA